ncbi:hypothetical protein GCM10023145_37500 [Angustibacter luteus]
MARALVRARLLRPGPVGAVLLVGVLGALPLASDGYPTGAVVQGLVSAVVVAAVLVWATHRRLMRATLALCPAGATLAVDLADDVLRVRTAVGEGQSPYADIREPLLVQGHVVLPMRRVRSSITLPPGLLTAADVAWLRERIALAQAPDVAGQVVAGPVVAGPVELEPERVDPDVVGGAVVLTAEMLERAYPAVLRYRLLRGRVGLAVPLISIGLGVWVGDAIGWVPGAAVALLFAGSVLLAAALQTRRTWRRSARVGRRLRSRFDDTHLHLDVDGAEASLAYTAIRRCDVRGDVVVLATTTGLLQVLPRELVPDEAVRRLRAAQG